jgi:peroxiredoxin Q/BCP
VATGTPASPAAATALPATPAAPLPLAVGDAAPDVTMTLSDGRTVALRGAAGPILVYFYPKDDTPGCRVEAQGLRDAWADVHKAGLTVYGVSTQDAASHKAFIDKERLPFPLVVDTSGEVARAFRVPLLNGLARRQSFLIGKDGKIARVWLEVDPGSHAAQVVAAVSQG